MRLAIGSCAALGILAAGCTLAKEAYFAATGARGRYQEVQAVGPLTAYDSFRVEPFSSELGRTVPPSLPALIQARIAARLLSDTQLAASGHKTLTIRGKIVYVELKPLRQSAIFPSEEVVCHVQLCDPSGTPLGWATVLGRNKSRVRGASDSLSELADGVGKALVEWLVSKGTPRRKKQKI